MAEICVLCLICDKPISVISIRNAYPRICPECKKRLREILYGTYNHDLPPKESES